MVKFGEEQWRAHAELVGAVALEWNRNVFQLLRVFTHLTGVETPLAEVIFFSSQSDSAQRHLIKRVAETVNLASSHRDALRKLLKRLEKVSTNRNLAVHTIFGLSAFDPETSAWRPTVVPALNPPQDRRLEIDFVTQFSTARRELDQIFNELENWLLHTPFPERAWGGPPMPVEAAKWAERRHWEIAQADQDSL